MNKSGLKKTLNLDDNAFNVLLDEFTIREKIDVIKNVIYGSLIGKTIGQVIKEISYSNPILIDRNYKKLNSILKEEKSLIAIAFKEVLYENFTLKTSGGGAI